MAKKRETIEELKSKLNRTELLLEINGQVAGLNDLSQILWKVIKFLTQELDADRATLFLNDCETNELYSRVAQGDLVREIRILNSVGIAEQSTNLKLARSFMMYRRTTDFIMKSINRQVTKQKI